MRRWSDKFKQIFHKVLTVKKGFILSTRESRTKWNTIKVLLAQLGNSIKEATTDMLCSLFWFRVDGSFNNYVDKKRWIAYQVASSKSTLFHITFESANFVVVQYLCKMSTIVQSMGWSKSGKLWSTQLQNDPSPRRSASDPRFGIQHVFPLNYEAERITQVNQSNTYS